MVDVRCLYILLQLLFASSQFIDHLQKAEELCIGENTFLCMDGGCINFSQFCDKKIDCSDGSDEALCDYGELDLLKCIEENNFICTDKKKCIPLHWVCNNEEECDDGSDEKNCSSVATFMSSNSSCKGYKCSDGSKCISALWVCDGTPDCPDGSDEGRRQLCMKKTVTAFDAFCGISHGRYPCEDGSFCLHKEQMCDKLMDCKDGSDEGAFCANFSSMCNNTKCSHNCAPTRDGPKCYCGPTMKLVNDTCYDVDECIDTDYVCSQTCHDFHGGYKCDCVSGYNLDVSGHQCYAEGGETLLFYSLRGEIRYINLRTKQDRGIVTDAKQAHGVVYDGFHVYWVDTAQGHQAIMRAEISDTSNTKEVVIDLGLENPGDVAIDWLTGNIYFSDADRSHIAACNSHGTKCVVFRNSIRHPRFVTLYPEKGLMYWVDWNEKPLIMRANMDSSEAQIFVQKHQNFPTGLTLDIPNQRLYWVDDYIHTIALDGTRRSALLRQNVHHPYALAVFENNLFWTDWASNTIQTCNKFDGQNRTLLVTKKSPAFGIHIFHPVLMRHTSHACQHDKCSDVCLLRGYGSYTCACPQDKQLDSDGHTCISIHRPQYILVAGGSAALRIRYNLLGRPEKHPVHLNVGRIDAIAYNPQKEIAYVFDGLRRSIEYIDMNNFGGGIKGYLVSDGLDQVLDMDYDIVSDSLYWVDTGRKIIEVFSLRTHSRGVIYKFGENEMPVSLCILPEYGKLWVALLEHEEGNIVHIDAIGLDGTGRQHVIQSGIKGTFIKLRYLQNMNTVYVSDEGNGIIDVIHPEGTGRETFRELHTTITSLAVTDNVVFWTNYKSPRLFWTDIHEAMHKTRRMELDVFPKNVQLHLVSITPPFSEESPIMHHQCARPVPPCSHICVQTAHFSPDHGPSNTYPSEYRCLCPRGMFLSNNGVCVKRITCNNDHFYCFKSNTCIDKSRKCDGTSNCKHGEDEDGCIVCSSSQKICNGKCIPASENCHFVPGTLNKCEDNKFSCMNDSQICLERTMICDRYFDCPDHSDEDPIFCSKQSCLDTQFMCGSGECILKEWMCDGEEDCQDESDEVDCGVSSCPENAFHCTNGTCIDVSHVCDGQDDCGNDEEGCYDDDFSIMGSMPECRDNEFACPNSSICLPITAGCDNFKDCPGGEDEDDCTECPRHMFKCEKNMFCVSMPFVCDKSKDCPDGSDETPKACKKVNMLTPHHLPITTPCHEGFVCSNGECVDYSETCNGIANCADGSDEHGTCDTACGHNSCQYKCSPTPRGAICLCPPGYRVGPDAKSCNDINECAEKDICSHVCRNTDGSFICSCHHGYALRPDHRSCKAIGEHMSIFYVFGQSIRSITWKGESNIVYNNPKLPIITDFDVHIRERKLYIVTESLGMLTGSNGTQWNIVVTNIGTPSKVIVDWISGNTYFVDNDKNRKRIRVCNVPLKRCAMLQQLPNNVEVTAFVLDPAYKKMFYCTTKQFESQIWMASLNGNDVELFANVNHCSGLTADSFKRRLYVAESGPGHILLFNYEGDRVRTLLTDDTHVIEPRGLAMFEDHIYFLTAHSLKITRCTVYGERKCEPFNLRVFNPKAFVIHHESTQRNDVTDLCKGFDCDNVCVNTQNGPQCVCHDGTLVDPGQGCPDVPVEELPLFNGWTAAGAGRVHRVSITMAISALVIALLAIVAFLVYHFVYKPRQRRNTPLQVFFQNYTRERDSQFNGVVPTIEITKPTESKRTEFVNPLQLMRDAFRSFTRSNSKEQHLIGTPARDTDSDTESDLDTREDRRLFK